MYLYQDGTPVSHSNDKCVLTCNAKFCNMDITHDVKCIMLFEEMEPKLSYFREDFNIARSSSVIILLKQTERTKDK